MSGFVAFAAMNALAVWLSALTADLVLPHFSGAERALAILVGFGIIVLETTILLGSFGQLTASSAILALSTLVVVIGISKRFIWSTGIATTIPPVEPANAASDEPLVRSLARVLIAALVGPLILKSLAGPTPFFWDDLSYHATAAAHWVVNGQLSVTPFNYHAYYPLNSEAVAAWFLLPLRSDAFVSLCGFYWLSLFLCSVFRLARILGCSATEALLVCAVTIAAPDVQASMRTYSAHDLSGVAMTLAALAFLSRGGSHPDPGSVRKVAYAGLAAGFAAGARTALVQVLVIVVAWLAFSGRRLTKRHRLAEVGVFAACCLVTGGFFYLRDWLLTGNPLFPAKVGPFNGPFGPAQQWRTELLSWILARPFDRGQWLVILKAVVNWPLALFLLALGGYLGAIYERVRSRRLYPASSSDVVPLMLFIGLLLFFTYPLLPFSGTHNDRAGTLVIERRYLILPFTIGMVLLAPMIRGTSRARTFLVALAVLGVMTGWSASPETSAVAAVCGIAALMFWDTAVTMRISRAVWAALGIAALLAGPRLLSAKQRMTASSLGSWGEQTRPIGQAWTAVDQLPRGARIASFGPSSYQYYALFGRSLQLIPVGLDSSGKPSRPLYDEWKEDPAKAAWWAEDEEPQAASFATNLLASRVQYVLVSKWDGTRWPPQQRILEQTAGATMVYHDGYSTIWRIGF